jgi:hypothetical protein
MIAGPGCAFWFFTKATPFSIDCILAAGAIFGFALAVKTSPLVINGIREDRAAAIVLSDCHPSLGGYRYSPYHQCWFGCVVETGNQKIALSGSGIAPSDSDLAVWRAIEPGLPGLVTTARDALLPPPPPFQHKTNVDFSIQSIEFLDHGQFELSLECEVVSAEANLWPVARFSSSLVLLSANWIP